MTIEQMRSRALQELYAALRAQMAARITVAALMDLPRPFAGAYVSDRWETLLQIVGSDAREVVMEFIGHPNSLQRFILFMDDNERRMFLLLVAEAVR